MRRQPLQIDDARAAEIAALERVLADAAARARTLAEQDMSAFGEVFARAELARQTMRSASERYRYKAENQQKMALVKELMALRRR